MTPALEGVVVEDRAGVRISERHSLRGAPGAEVHRPNRACSVCVGEFQHPELAVVVRTPAHQRAVVHESACVILSGVDAFNGRADRSRPRRERREDDQDDVCNSERVEFSRP